MLRAIEYKFNTTTYQTYPNYSASTPTLGRLMKVYTGVTAIENYAGPFKMAVARPMEQSTAIPGVFPFAYRWSDSLDWIFLADNATAALTRRVVLYEFDRSTTAFNWKGFVTLGFPTGGTYTIRGFRVTVDEYTAGTVSVAGTAVTGSGTQWSSARLGVGARMGFGTTDPTQVTEWYPITGITSDTSITLNTSAGSIAGGTSYVIEEIRLILANTNATAQNGGLFVAKGVNYNDFTNAGTIIPSATTTDNQKAVYFLRDGIGAQVNTAACGMGITTIASWSSQTAYVIDSTTNPRIYAYNLRAQLTGLTAGSSRTAILFSTGTQAVTGTLGQTNNGRVGALSHAPVNSVNSLYFTTGTRIYRVALSNLLTGSTTWISDSMVEIPPGSTSSFPATGALANVEISDYIDRLIVHSTGAAGVRSYISKYNTVSDEMDEIFLIDTKQQDQSLANADLPPTPTIAASVMSSWVEGGQMYTARIGTTAAVNQLYAFPLGADWIYAASTGERLISPEFSTPNVSKFQRVMVNHTRSIGDINYGVTPEPFRLYYRTTGISDNSGAWTLVDDTGDLTGVASSSSIQFMIEFKVISSFCHPARIHSITVTYEDETTDSHYQPSAGLSSTTNKRFAWRFSTAFGSTVPTLRVRLYDAVSGGLLVDDNTASPTGTFEKSTDGGSGWSAYDTTDKANETTYIRYTPASLGDNIKVRALLTQN